MLIESIKFRRHGCFVNEWAGFDQIKPINLIIGKNNTGKSQLLELVQMMCSGIRTNTSCDFHCKAKLDEESLRLVFQEGDNFNDIAGDAWRDHGALFIDWPIAWQRHSGRVIPDIETDGNRKFSDIDYSMAALYSGQSQQYITDIVEMRIRRIIRLIENSESSLSKKEFCRLFADRDILPEPPSQNLDLLSSGAGATNIIRRYVNSSSANIPRARIQYDLKFALNEIFGDNGHFTEIQPQEHDEGGSSPVGHWEIYLREDKKGLIALSKSGSGLKTVILVLLNLLVLPKINNKPPSDFVFAFEELENNLHPALLRRLLRYIEKFAIENEAVIFLTTHSNVALDLFGTSEHAQIVHVTHDGSTARTSTIDTHFRMLDVVSELGAKPSDILQANGIIWVEGPSDAIYLNKWIEIASEGKLKQGRDYLCTFYGGALLARTQFSDPGEEDADLINLLLANPNVAVVCDSDRISVGQKLKSRVIRIRDEISKVSGGLIWVTSPKEIENYLAGSVLTKALDLRKPAKDPEQFENFFPVQKKPGSSYIEKELGRISFDKIDLALRCREHLTRAEMELRFDWKQQMESLLATIKRWNK